MESIQDLLEPESKDIKIREDPEKGVCLEGIQWFKCNSPEECEQIFHKGELNRNTECTKMNAHSSRSHAILIMKIEKSIKITDPKYIKDIKNNDNLLTYSYLHLVDLAGSERVRKTGATDIRLEEAKKINLSLLCLGNVISSLSNPNASYISYRDSKLTRILKESLGGNAKTSLIVTVSPSTYNTEETMSSLYFALKAMKIQNKPIINKTIDYQVLCIKLQDDLDKLNDDYAKLKIEYDKVNEELEKYKKNEQYFDFQKKFGMSCDLSLQLNSIDNTTNTTGDFNLNNTNFNTNSTGSNNISIENSKKKNEENNINDAEQNMEINNNNFNSKVQIQKLKEFYEKLMKNKTEEYENIIKKVDDMVYKKESEIEKLNSQINDLNIKIKKQKEELDDMSKEKEDLQNSVSTLSIQVEEQKNLLKNDKTEKEYKALIEILNDNISALEKKIIKLEDTSIFSETSKEKIINSLDSKINEFQSEINNLTQKKNNSMIKKSQNEIKINLMSNEKNLDYKKNEKINQEITQIQKENLQLLIELESTTKKIEVFESQIKSTKEINKSIQEMLDKYNKIDKADLIMSLAKKEIDNMILNDSVKAYDYILMNVIESQHEDKFKLYKVENDMNNLINKSSLLLNNYLNYINKLDDINKELDIVINEPDNFNKLNKMRQNIESLIDESEEINNITKSYNLYNNRNLNNIPYDKCPTYLENILSSISENFLILIETYNFTNSNICQLISLMEESYCYKKKFVSNLSSFVQENVKDIFTKQNITYKLTELLKKKVDEKEYNNKMEEIIRELFEKITISLSEKDKENKLLSLRVNLYMKQIDENVKQMTINNKNRCITNRENMTIEVTDNEINKLKLKINKQQKAISSAKINIEKINTIINKVINLIKNINMNTFQTDINKINETLNECKNISQNMSKGLNDNLSQKPNLIMNLKKNCKTNINEILRQSIRDENMVNVRNIKDKHLSQKLFKQYFINLSKFSKTITDYALNDDEDNKND